MPIQVTFQLDNSRERAEMTKYINAIEASQYPHENRQEQTSDDIQVVGIYDSPRVKELENEKKKLQEEIKKHQQNNVKNEERIRKLQEELDAVRDENEKKIKEAEENKKLFEEACEDTKKMKEKYEHMLQQKDEEREAEIKRVVDFRDEKDKELNAKICALQKQLEVWNPSINTEGSTGQKFYLVNGDSLIRTNDDTALYVAHSAGDNMYKFQFNCKKGPIREAFLNKEKDILPFCDIIAGGELESVGRIEPVELGQAVMSNEDLKVIIKAKIKLYRD